jgi:predicted MFS family arabinose efflux permease
MIPFGMATLLLTLYVKPAAPVSDRQARFDVAGALLLVGGLTATIFGLMQSSDWGWLDWRVIALLVAGAGLLIGFVLIEPHRRDPLIEMRLFHSGNFSTVAIVLFFIGAPATVTSIWGARYLQDVLGFSPSAAGLALMPLSIPLLLLSVPGGRLYDKLGPRIPLTIGLSCLTVAMLFGALALEEREYAWLVPSLVLIGVGLGFSSTPANTEGMNSSPEKLRGEAAGALQTVGQAGNTFIVAIMTTLVATIENAKVGDYLELKGITNVTVDQVEGLLAEVQGGDPSELVNVAPAELTALIAAVQDAFTAGTQAAYLVTGGIMALLLVLALVRLPGRGAVRARRAHLSPAGDDGV